MSRIEGIPTRNAGGLLRLVYRYATHLYGAVPEPVTVLAHHRRLLQANLRHELAVLRSAKALPASVGELAQYRVAQQLGCSWCVDFSTMLQRMADLDVPRLRDIDDYETSAAFSPTERLAVRYADAMTRDPTTVTDEQVTELVHVLGTQATIELTYLIGLENMRARVNTALGIVDQGFTSGDACRVPVPADAPAPPR